MGKLPLSDWVSGVRALIWRESHQLRRRLTGLTARRLDVQPLRRTVAGLTQTWRGRLQWLHGLATQRRHHLDAPHVERVAAGLARVQRESHRLHLGLAGLTAWGPVGRFHRERPLVFYAVIGVVIRFAVAPFCGHPYDLRIFMAVSWAVAHGVSPYSQYMLQELFTNMAHPHLYGLFYGIGYPPPWGLILGFMYQLSTLIHPNDIYVLVLCLKIPIILSDLAAAFVIYRILARTGEEATALRVFRFYQLCPFAIIIGAVWGMFDVLVFLLSLVSAYWLLEKPKWSVLALGAACSLKLYPLVLAPLYALFLYRRSRSAVHGAMYAVGVGGFLAFLTLIPMAVFQWPVSNLYYAMASHMSSTNPAYNGEMNLIYGAASPFNLYNVLQLIDPGVEPHSGLNYLWVAVLGVLYLYALRRITEIDFRSIVNWSFVVILAFFTSRFWVSEQNLVLLFSFFLLVVLLNGHARDWKHVHALWILLFVFVVIHVPVTAFLWIPAPQSLDLAVAPFAGAWGACRQVLMSGLTLTWLSLLWHYFLRRPLWW